MEKDEMVYPLEEILVLLNGSVSLDASNWVFKVAVLLPMIWVSEGGQRAISVGMSLQRG